MRGISIAPIAVTLILGSAQSLLAAEQYICATNASGEITNSSWGPVSPGVGDCSYEALGVKLEMFDSGYCTSEPSATDTSMCSFWDLEGNPAVVEITKNGISNLIPQKQIPPGTYTHSVVYMTNRAIVRASLKFANSRTGRTGSGRYCWTVSGNWVNSNDASYPRSSYTAECGSSPPSSSEIEYTNYIYDRLGVGLFSATSVDIYSGRVKKHHLLDKEFNPITSELADGILMTIEEFVEPIVFKEGYQTIIDIDYPISTQGVHVNSNNYPTIKKFLTADADTVVRYGLVKIDD